MMKEFVHISNIWLFLYFRMCNQCKSTYNLHTTGGWFDRLWMWIYRCFEHLTEFFLYKEFWLKTCPHVTNICCPSYNLNKNLDTTCCVILLSIFCTAVLVKGSSTQHQSTVLFVLVLLGDFLLTMSCFCFRNMFNLSRAVVSSQFSSKCLNSLVKGLNVKLVLKTFLSFKLSMPWCNSWSTKMSTWFLVLE